MEINSSQEIIYSTQHNDCYQLSTQEVIEKVSTQEAMNASEFLENLEIKSSQESVANQDLITSKTRKSLQIENKVKEKKKRGRKRKIRTDDELRKHMKDKKEKNRLAAQRLRQRKCNEIVKYENEVEKYERLVESKRTFALHLKTKVDQLRNRIKSMVPEKSV